MLTQLKKTFVATTAIFMFASTSFAQTVSIETAQGPVTLSKSPETIAVFDVAAVDTLDALGITPQGTVSNLYVNYLANVSETATPVGSLFEPDFEAINALAPDLVILGGRSSTQIDAMSALATSIDMTIWGDDLVEQALARLTAYGILFDREDEAAELAEKFIALQNTAIAAAAGKGNALIVMTNGPKISAYGAGSRFGWLHKSLGIEEAIEGVDEATHGEAISFEFIHDANPDWLIVIDRVAAIGSEGESALQTLDNELIADTDAWKNGRVIYLNSANIYIAGGGIQSLMGEMTTIINAFSGDS